MKTPRFFASILGTVLLVCSAPSNLQAQHFAAYPAGDDAASSLGEFRLVVDSAWVDIVDAALAGSVFNTTETWPGSGLLIYDGGVFTSPVLYDPATVIGRSDPLVSGSVQDTAGVIAGRAPGRTYVSDSQMPVRPGWPDAPGLAYEIHTFMKSLVLSDAVTTHLGISVKAGMDAPTRPVSAGEVEAYSAAADFPARSFFNVYVQLDMPASGALPAVQLVNKDPLLVENATIYSLPPRAFYIHGNTNAVPVYFNQPVLLTSGGNTITIPRGTLFGQLTLAGHGMSYAEYEIASFETEVEASVATSTMALTVGPTSNVNLQDYSPNYAAVPVPLVSQLRLTNGAFSFTISSVTAARTNYIQACTNLAQGNWQTIRTNVPATNTYVFTDPGAAASQRRFYRVLSLP